MITDFYSCFVAKFPLVYRCVRLKPFGHPFIEFFDKEVGFQGWLTRSGYTCVDSMMGPSWLLLRPLPFDRI